MNQETELYVISNEHSPSNYFSKITKILFWCKKDRKYMQKNQSEFGSTNEVVTLKNADSEPIHNVKLIDDFLTLNELTALSYASINALSSHASPLPSSISC